MNSLTEMSFLTTAHAVLDKSPGPVASDPIYRRLIDRGIGHDRRDDLLTAVSAAASDGAGRDRAVRDRKAAPRTLTVRSAGAS